MLTQAVTLHIHHRERTLIRSASKWNPAAYSQAEMQRSVKTSAICASLSTGDDLYYSHSRAIGLIKRGASTNAGDCRLTTDAMPFGWAVYLLVCSATTLSMLPVALRCC